MKNIYYSLTIALSLLIIVSCSTESTPIYQLTTSVEPTEAGTVSPTSSEFEEGEQVNITASPNEHWVFDSWQGGQAGSTNPATVTMDSDKNITALFIKREYPLTVNTEGEGSVAEEVVQRKTTDYESGTTVELTANPADGWTFVEWQGDATGSDNPATITVDEAKEVTAVFERKDYPLTVNTEGEGSVAEEVIQAKTTDYPFETNVELTANPADGWTFVEWSGDLNSSENPETITVEEEKSVTASFAEIFYTVDISLDGEGKVNETLIEGEENENGYAFGSKIEIEVIGDGDYSFLHWDGELEGTDNPVTITIVDDITATAVLDNSPFAGGNGSEMYPYQVSTIEQLQAIRDYPDKHYLQINDIDASATLNWNEGKGFRPIGDNIIPFEGTYDGNMKSIQTLFINNESTSNTGLFGWSEKSKFHNINLIDVNISGGGVRSAALAGRLSESIISNCHVIGTIKNVSLNSGGLVGDLTYNSIIKNSSAVIDISASGQFGILAGNVGSSSQIIDSYAEGEAIGEHSFSSYIGGLVGINRGRIENSFSIAVVTGENKIGGLVGQHSGSGTVINSYTDSEVEGIEEVGGLIGIVRDNSTVKNSYSGSSVSGTTDIGGLIGLNGNVVEESYWDSDKTNQSDGVGRGNSDGVKGLSTSNMQGSSVKENMPEFDWDNVWITTDGYPKLRWQ